MYRSTARLNINTPGVYVQSCGTATALAWLVAAALHQQHMCEVQALLCKLILSVKEASVPDLR